MLMRATDYSRVRLKLMLTQLPVMMIEVQERPTISGLLLQQRLLSVGKRRSSSRARLVTLRQLSPPPLVVAPVMTVRSYNAFSEI
jgi:hypothetical protein